MFVLACMRGCVHVCVCAHRYSLFVFRCGCIITLGVEGTLLNCESFIHIDIASLFAFICGRIVTLGVEETLLNCESFIHIDIASLFVFMCGRIVTLGVEETLLNCESVIHADSVVHVWPYCNNVTLGVEGTLLNCESFIHIDIASLFVFMCGRIVTLSVEEAGEPVGSGGAMSDPVVNEGTAQNQVVDPATPEA